MSEATQLMQGDDFARLVGVSLLDAEDGKARATLNVDHRHGNAVGLTHGGAIFTLAACAFFAAANSRGRVAVGIECHVAFLHTHQGGPLVAQAEEVSLNPKIAVYAVRVTDRDNMPIATFQGTAYRRKESVAQYLPASDGAAGTTSDS